MPQRSWGTRYAPLTNAPTSPVTQRTEAASAIPTPHSPTSSPMRVVGSVPSTPATVKPEKISHDIFVGSLPSAPDVNLEQLGKGLTEHLKGHEEVNSVKVVRDRKGGVCAFVQCKDATAADVLLRKLQGPNEPMFDGRRLRYEPAHAFRTLLISYRTPLRISSSPGLDQSINTRTPDDALLHDAMRISMLDNSKRYEVRYDDDARADPSPESDNIENTRFDHPLRGSGLLISPLKFDDKTLRTVVSAFGPIEYFGLFDTKTKTSKDGVNAAASANAHCGPRSEGMDTNVFEVKWEHRDDCMNASMTLRFVPHLVVTWAHLAYTDSGDVSGYKSRISSPAMSPSTRFPSYPRSRTQSRSHLPAEHQPLQFCGIPPVMSSFGFDGSQFNDGSQSPDKHWAPSYSSPYLHGPSFSLSGQSLTSGPPGIFQPSSNWTTVDFPPLHDRSATRLVKKSVKPLDLAWAPRDSSVAESEVCEANSAASLSPTSSLSVQPSTPDAARSLMSPAIDETVSQSQPSSPSPDDQTGLELGQDLTMPPTPDFTTSSITPVTPKTGNSFPRTPPSVINAFNPGDHGTPAREHKGDRYGSFPRDVDSCCIWVGGLDETWDKESLKKAFGEYGDVSEVTLVQPKPPNTAAFAFVKYKTPEAAVKAVEAKDRCVYGTRAITVRLRELSRGGQKSLNRGRPHSSKTTDSRLSGIYHHGGSSQAYEPRPKVTRSQSRSSHLSAKPEELEFPSLNGTRPAHDTCSQEQSVSGASSTSPESSVVDPSAGMGSVAPYPMVVSSQSWMQPYPLSYGYSAPYPAHYMGYPAPVPQYQYASGVGDDINTRSQYHWPKVGVQQSQSGTSDPQAEQDYTQIPGVQPPLRPTHFIKDEHGGITAIYPPEALNQYLTSTGSPHSEDSSPQMSAPQRPQAAQSQPPPTGWGPYPQPGSQMPVMYSYPYGPTMPYATPHGAQYIQPGSWPQNGVPPAFVPPAQHQPPNTQQFPTSALPHPQTLSTPPPYLLPSVSSGSLSSSSSFRGGYPVSGSANQVDSRGPQAYGNKRFGRRDQAMGHGHGAHHNFRHPAPHTSSGYPTANPSSSPGRGRGIPASNSYAEHMSAGVYQQAHMRRVAPYSAA